jgi:oligogalacturonide lyase
MKARVIKAGFVVTAILASSVCGQMGRRWPSEKKVVPDPVTGIPLCFLTTDPARDSKIYQTHQQWTADDKWLIFRGSRGTGAQAFAVNEETGDIVQATENGYMGMLCNAHKRMTLLIMRNPGGGLGRDGVRGPAMMAPAETAAAPGAPAATTPPATPPGRRGGRGPANGGQQIIEIDLARLFADSAAGTVKAPSDYERLCGTVPPGINAGGNMAVDANDDVVYFSVTGPDTAQLSEGQTLQQANGQRRMGAGPSGLRSMNLKTGEVMVVCNVGFQIGHVQTNPVAPGEIVFCWETGGKAPQRTWFVNANGTGLRPLYPEAPYEWITHEAAINKDEVAIAILCHRRPGVNDGWGTSGTAEHPTGLGIVNLRTREMRIAGQVPFGDPGRSDWHVAGSPDGRWAAFDDFRYRLWLIDRHTGETVLLADLGHKTTAGDHIHPTFSLDSTKIEVQCAMLAPDNRSLDICVVPVPQTWLDRTYSERLVP